MALFGNSSNPALGEKVFAKRDAAGTGVMTVNGTMNKTLILFFLVLLGAAYTWKMFFTSMSPEAGYEKVGGWITGAGIAGFIAAMVTIFKKSWAGYTAPIYAILEGLFLGALSALFESMFPGIVIQAIGLTLGVMLTMLLLYRAKIIVVTDKFRMGLFAAIGGVFLIYMASFILSFFGTQIPYIHEGGTVGIIFSLVVVVIAALSLALDFDMIERGAQAGAPKYMEWYGAFGLMVTLIWLYLEILKLLAKLYSRD